MINLEITNGDDVDRINNLLSTIGDDLDSVYNFFSWVKSSQSLPKPSGNPGSQTITRGETDGTMGMEIVKQLLNWNQKSTLILSGGVYGREKSIGDIGAIDLYKHVEYDLSLYGLSSNEIKQRTIIDSFSMHTIDQGRVLSGILRAIGCKDMIIVMPLYHFPRFTLILAHDLKKLNIKPNIICMPFGDWDYPHPRKGYNGDEAHRFSYYDLFTMPPIDSKFKGKADCGEIDKIVASVNNNNSLSFNSFMKWINS